MSFLFLSSSFFLDWNDLVWSSNSNCEEVRSGGLTSFLSFVLGIKSVVFAKFSFASRTTSTSFEVFFSLLKNVHTNINQESHILKAMFSDIMLFKLNLGLKINHPFQVIRRCFPTIHTECILPRWIKILLHFTVLYHWIIFVLEFLWHFEIRYM